MASVYDVKVGVATSSTSTADDEGKITRTHVVPYTITLDDGTNDTTETVERAAQLQGDLPSEHDTHPLNNSLRVTSINTTQKSVIYYESKVTYSTKPFRQGQENDSALQFAAELEYFSATELKRVDDDFDGNPLENNETREQFSMEVEQVDLGVTIKKNMLVFNGVSIYLFTNKVNSDTFLGFPPGTAKIHSIQANTAVEDDVTYYEVTVQILFRQARANQSPEFAWYQRIKHEGYYAMFNGNKARIYQKNAAPYDLTDDPTDATAITQPVLLKENGEILGENDTPYFLLVKQYGQTPFANLGLLP